MPALLTSTWSPWPAATTVAMALAHSLSDATSNSRLSAIADPVDRRDLIGDPPGRRTVDVGHPHGRPLRRETAADGLADAMAGARHHRHLPGEAPGVNHRYPSVGPERPDPPAPP